MGTALAVHIAVAPTKHERLKLAATDSLGGSFRAVMRNVLDHIRANIEPAERGDPEGIHQVRVGIRRARAALRLYRGVLPANMFTRFDRRLRNFGRAFGEARDWDVLLTETVKKDWPEIERVRERCSQQQGYSRQHVSLMLTVSPHFTNLIERLGIWADAVQFDDVAIVDATIGDMAPKMLAPMAKKVKKRHKRARQDDPTSLHRLRKSTKWLRYAAEFVGSMYRKKKVKRYLGSVKDGLDQLGTVNDAVVAENLLYKVNLLNEVKPALERYRQRTLKQVPDAMANLKLKAFWT